MGSGKSAAENLTKLKKPAMAEAAAQRLEGRGWLPAILRGSEPEATDEELPQAA